MYRCCKYTLNTACPKAIKRDREKALKMYYYGVRKNHYAWQECEDAVTLAYLYGIGRCAAERYVSMILKYKFFSNTTSCIVDIRIALC